MNRLPETILQFGAGRFLRAFFDRFVSQANEGGQSVGQIVVVQSTPGSRAELLANQPDGFQVLVRGYEAGQLVDRVDRVRSISRALVADAQWDAVLEAARSPDLKTIVTNATEAGYVHSPSREGVPATMPGKLTAVLFERYQSHGQPLTMLPCELIERNADTLRQLIVEQAQAWSLPGEFIEWVVKDCVWLNNLVDCIVTVPPTDHPLAGSDPLLVSAEPYALLAIERPAAGMPDFVQHPAIQVVENLTPYYLRKVRILNGTHTAMTARFLPAGFKTVKEVLDDREASRWVRGVMFEEIVPTLVGQVDGAFEFAETTYDRLRNPFLNHRLSDIASNHAAKVAVRLQPTFEEYTRLYQKHPRRMGEIIAWRP